MDGVFKFGFLPAHVLYSINDLGNWKNRSMAIDQVQQGLLSLGDKAPLLKQLPEFVDFVVQLLQDHNFKIAIAGLNILADLASICGSLLQSHLSMLTSAVHDKLLDPREVVTAAAVKACGNLMRCCLPSSPMPLINRLMQLLQQGGGDRQTMQPIDISGILEVLILAQLSYNISQLDMSAAAEVLLTGLASRSPKQQALALEGLALATDALGPQLPQLLRHAGAAEVDITSILQKTGKLQRPSLSADNTVRHGAEVQAAAAASRDGNTAEGGIMEFTIKAYRSNAAASMRFAAADGGDVADLCLSKFSTLKLQSDSALSSNSTSSPPGSPKSKLIWTAPAAGGSLGRPAAAALHDEVHRSQLQQDEQLLPPGSLSTLAAHAQLIHHANNMGRALISSVGDPANAARRTASLPSRHDLSDNSAPSTNSSIGNGSLLQPAAADGSPISVLRGAPGGWDVTGYGGVRTSSGRPRRSSAEFLEDLASASATPTATGTSCSLQSSLRASIGSSSSIAAAAAAATNAGNGGSLNASLNSSLRSSGGLSSSAAAQPKLDLPKSRFFGEEPVSEQQQASRVASGSQQYTNTAVEGLGVAKVGQPGCSSSNDRYDQQQQQSSLGNPMRQLNWSFGRDNCQGVGSVLQDIKQAAGSPEPSYVSSRPAHSAATNQPITSSGGSCSWMAAGGPGWAQAEEQDNSCASTPGRPETLSPTRGERLAQLKRRQHEKRGSSAAGGPRPDMRDYSPSPDCLLGYASGQAAAAISSLPATAASPYAEGSNCSRWASSCGTNGSPEPWPAAGGGGPADPHSNGSSSSRSNAHEAVAGVGPVPLPLLKWNLQTVPDGRPVVQQQGPQQHMAGSSLMHLHSLPAGISLEPAAGGLMGRGSAVNAILGGCIRSGAPAQRSSSDVAAAARSGILHLSANSAEAPSYSPSGSRTALSAAAVLTGTDAGGLDTISTDGSGGNGSPTIRQRRLGAGGSLGLQQPVSASPEYPGASKSSAASRQAAASPAFGAAAGSPAQLRAQTAAAAVGLTADWAAVSFGSGHGSPSAGAVSPVSRRGSVIDRPQSVGPEGFDMSSDLAPLPDPEASMRQAIIKLQQSNTAARKELDWQGQLEALIDARRLVAHHLEVLRPAAHELVLAALPAVEELRSTTARMGLLLFQELPPVLGRGIERELDEIVPVLLKKAGELSTAGRDNFLATEADKALSAVWAAVSESRALTALMASGMQHKSPHVRCRAAAHLDEVAAGGAGLEGLVRGNWSLLERVFKAAAAFLQEGSLDTRTYGKRLLWAVKAAVRSNRADMDRLLAAVTPDTVQRRVIDVVDGLSAAPPPPPGRPGAAGMASRGSSRGPGTPTSAQHTISSAVSSPSTPNSSFGAAATAATPQGSSSRVITGTGSNNNSSRARRQLLPAGSNSNNSTDNAVSKLHVQGAGTAAGGSNSAVDSPLRRRSRTTAEGAPSANSSGSASAGFMPAAPPGPPGPMSPELQEAVAQVGLHLASKDWRSRTDALCALSALLPALPEVPNGPLEELLNGVVARLSDGNAKVNVQALQVLTEVLGTVEARILLVMPTLAPALAANLGSANERVRSSAAAVMDNLVAVVQPGVLLQSLSHIAMHSSNARAKVVLVEKLTALSPQVYRYQPQVVVKQLLPTAFALALDARGDLRQPAAQLLGVLARLMGPGTLLNHAAMVSNAVESKVRDLLPADWA